MTPTDDNIRQEFARRLHEVCSDMKLPIHGRQSRIAEKFGVRQPAANKWFSGKGLPELATVVAIASWANVNTEWLLSGRGPKRGAAMDMRAVILSEALLDLPQADRDELLNYLDFKLRKAAGSFIAAERIPRYEVMIEAFKHNGQH